MNIRTVFYGICVVGLLTRCSGSSSHDPNPTAHDTPRAEQAVSQDTTTISVNVVVLTRDDGTGNELWDLSYVQALLAQVTTHVGDVVQFQLRHRTELASADDHASNQRSLLYELRDLRMAGVVTVIISNPDTTDFAGISFVQYSESPYLVMRARVQDWSGIDEAARIFLHELGHNINLQHETQAHLPYHTDDYWMRDDGRQYLVDYALFLEGDQDES